MALPPQQFCVRWNSYHTNLQAVFPRLLLTEQFADVTLACEARQLRCHKLVLSACSAYLERLLLQNPCDHPIVLMRDMRFSEMQALVDFMYKGEVNVTQEELPSLLKSAEALQIRGLCSSEPGGLPSEVKTEQKDFALASDALVAHARDDVQNQTQPKPITTSTVTNGPKKRKSEERERTQERERERERVHEVKEETVEEDGLYYGELDHDQLEYHEDEEPGKPGSSLGQTSGRKAPFIRVKPESELFFQNKLQSLANSEYMSRLSKMNASEIQKEFSKYGLTNMSEETINKNENDYYKSWLEQNGELEVSLLKVNQVKKSKEIKNQRSEIELIPRHKDVIAKEIFPKIGEKTRRRGRPPIFKDKNVDIGETVLKADLDQFLEGKEVSSSGLSRKDLERVMMGKFNPNRRYSNEAMWAALMDVKKGGSIYRAAQTHKVPRKSLRNWMKRCHIKSSFPMPQQLKQFVENSKKQREQDYHSQESDKPETYGSEMDFGKHFLSFAGQVSSEDEAKDGRTDDKCDGDGGEPGESDEFAIANVQCQYEGSDTEIEEASRVTGDHNYDTRDEPPAFIIHQIPPMATSGPFVEVRPGVVTLAPGCSPAVNVIHVGDRSVMSSAVVGSGGGECGMNKRIRRSEVVLRQAADCVSRGSTFQTVSEQFNIPISTIRFFMARKGILPRRRRGRSTQARTACSSPEPPFQMQHFKLPDMLALRSDDESSNA